MAETKKLEFPELAAALRSRKIGDFLKFFGPGAIIASVTIGSGETVWASRSGAIFGYAMFWAFSLFCITKVVQVYSAARYMTLTGEHPMERWAQLPGPRGLFPAVVGVVMVVSFPFYLSSLPIMLGTISSWILFDDPARYPHLIALIFIAFLIMLTLKQSYGLLEKAQTSLVGLMLLVMLIATVAANPDWIAALMGAVVPTFPVYPEWVSRNPMFADRTLIVEMVAYMGVIGGGVQDYVGYVGMLREKVWGMIGRRSNEKETILETQRKSRIGQSVVKSTTGRYTRIICQRIIIHSGLFDTGCRLIASARNRTVRYGPLQPPGRIFNSIARKRGRQSISLGIVQARRILRNFWHRVRRV